jgi:hypothetical protein
MDRAVRSEFCYGLFCKVLSASNVPDVFCGSTQGEKEIALDYRSLPEYKHYRTARLYYDETLTRDPKLIYAAVSLRHQ